MNKTGTLRHFVKQFMGPGMPLFLRPNEPFSDGCQSIAVLNQFGDPVGQISEDPAGIHRVSGVWRWTIGSLSPHPTDPQVGREDTLELAKAALAKRWRSWLAQHGFDEETWRYVSPTEAFRRDAMATFEREGVSNLGSGTPLERGP